jgi:RNA polymerase sigma-70 factor (ECF subfamily)
MRLLQKQQKLEYNRGEGDLTDHLNKLTADPYFDLDTVSYAFHESLIKLPEKQQRIFQMKYFDELTFDEIAEITTWNKNSIKTAFYAAKEKIIIQVKATV